MVAPRGIGDVEDAHAVGEVGSMVGGLGVRISLHYGAGEDGTSRITAAAGRAFGSAAPLAAISWLTTALQGATWDDACGYTHEQVLAALCEHNGRVLPEAVARGTEFAVRALRRALGVAARGKPADPAGRGILVCRCLGVGDRAIRRAIRAGARDPEAIGESTSACTGCRSCRPDLLALIAEETLAPAPVPAPALHPAAQIALARVGPILRGLGLPLEDASVRDGTVHVRLGPRAPGACISAIGAIAVSRHVLREIVADDVRVEQDA